MSPSPDTKVAFLEIYSFTNRKYSPLEEKRNKICLFESARAITTI